MRVLEQNEGSIRREQGECQNRKRSMSGQNKGRVLEQNKESVRTEQGEC